MKVLKIIVLTTLLIQTFLSVLSARYLLVKLDGTQYENTEEAEPWRTIQGYDYFDRLIPSDNPYREGGVTNTAGYKKMKIDETKQIVEEDWNDFFEVHNLCDEKTAKCQYMDRCMPSNASRPCKPEQFNGLEHGTNLMCAKAHEIRPCTKKNRTNCGEVWYYFTDCNMGTYSEDDVCFCLQESAIRKSLLTATDECKKQRGACQYGDFCSIDGVEDPCLTMGDIYVPSPISSGSGNDSITKIPMKCTSMTAKRDHPWSSPSCQNANDICTCQDSGTDPSKLTEMGQRHGQFDKGVTRAIQGTLSMLADKLDTLA